MGRIPPRPPPPRPYLTPMPGQDTFRARWLRVLESDSPVLETAPLSQKLYDEEHAEQWRRDAREAQWDRMLEFEERHAAKIRRRRLMHEAIGYAIGAAFILQLMLSLL